jgi:hypothetical protein
LDSALREPVDRGFNRLTDSFSNNAASMPSGHKVEAIAKIAVAVDIVQQTDRHEIDREMLMP